LQSLGVLPGFSKNVAFVFLPKSIGGHETLCPFNALNLVVDSPVLSPWYRPQTQCSLTSTAATGSYFHPKHQLPRPVPSIRVRNAIATEHSRA
jgi:hypothetical protein